MYATYAQLFPLALLPKRAEFPVIVNVLVAFAFISSNAFRCTLVCVVVQSCATRFHYGAGHKPCCVVLDRNRAYKYGTLCRAMCTNTWAPAPHNMHKIEIWQLMKIFMET